MWRVDASGHGRPTVGGGVAYFLLTDHKVVAVESRNGRRVWTNDTFEPGLTTDGSALALSRSVIVAGDYNLVAFDRLTGERRWRFSPTIGYAPGIYLGDSTDSVVLAGSPAGRVYAVAAATGELVWTSVIRSDGKTTVFPPTTDGVVVAIGYTTFQGPPRGGAVLLDLATGRELWRTAFPLASDPLLGTGSTGGPLLTSDSIIASSGDGTVYILSRTDGSIVWTIPGISGVPPVLQGPFPLPHTSGGADFRPLTRSGRRLFAGSLKGAVVAYDLPTRREIWRHEDPRAGSVSFAIASDERFVHVPYASGRHVALDAATGALRWRTADAAYGFNWAAASDDRHTYLAGGAGGLIAVRR